MVGLYRFTLRRTHAACPVRVEEAALPVSRFLQVGGFPSSRHDAPRDSPDAVPPAHERRPCHRIGVGLGQQRGQVPDGGPEVVVGGVPSRRHQDLGDGVETLGPGLGHGHGDVDRRRDLCRCAFPVLGIAEPDTLVRLFEDALEFVARQVGRQRLPARLGFRCHGTAV